MIQKVYKFKLKTNSKEKVFFSKSSGCVRFVWNKTLSVQQKNLDYIRQQFDLFGGRSLEKKEAEKLKKALYQQYFPTGFDFATKALTSVWKKSEELSFLNDCPSQSLLKPLAELEKAFLKKGSFPRFKKKGEHDSIHFPQGFKVKDNKVFFPKIGWMKFFKTRSILGKIKNVTVTSDGIGNWFASFFTENDVDIVERHGNDIGIDLGITNFAATSTGEIIKKPPAIKTLAHIKKRVQRAISRKKKGSANQGRLINVLRKIDQKITNIRKDFLHKLSTKISKNHATVFVEDLKVKKRSKSAKGTLEKPGFNVQAKSGLKREILANGWSMFLEMLNYKQKDSGGVFLAVNPQYISQTCSSCGVIRYRIKQDLYRCDCGNTMHADINAARNIQAAGWVAVRDISGFGCKLTNSRTVM